MNLIMRNVRTIIIIIGSDVDLVNFGINDSLVEPSGWPLNRYFLFKYLYISL
jgi:hypothetical protein